MSEPTDPNMAKRHWYGFTKVETDLQIRHVSQILACASIYVVVSTALFVLFYVSRTGGFSGEGPLLALGWLLSMSGMSALFALFVGLSVTRRIAGPVYRMKCDLARFLDGDEGVRIHLRRRDSDLSELADLINRALERTARSDAERSAAAPPDLRVELRKILDEIEEASGRPTPEAVDALAARLQALAAPASSTR